MVSPFKRAVFDSLVLLAVAILRTQLQVLWLIAFKVLYLISYRFCHPFGRSF